VHQELEKNI